MPAFYTYMIECTDKNGNVSYYTGYTHDLYQRFRAHSEGKGAKYTRGKKLKLVYYETYTTRPEAMGRERELKTWSHEQKAALLKGSENNED